MSRILFVLILLTTTASFAYEIDNLTSRYIPLKDSNEVLNQEVNSALIEAVETANSKSLMMVGGTPDPNYACNTIRLLGAVNGTLGGGIIGTLETVARKSPLIQRSTVDTIYDNGSLADKAGGIIRTIFGVGPSINLNGYFVGSDKLGHFFDQGFDSYGIQKERQEMGASYSSSVKSFLNYNLADENGKYGLTSTGVKSYADIAAAYSGYKFWSNIYEGSNPYFRCQDGKWKQVRSFTWADYVDSSWDEGINCNDFKEALQETVNKNVAELERRSGGRQTFTCPVNISECAKIAKQYKDKVEFMIGPKCLQAAKNYRGSTDGSVSSSGNKSSGYSGATSSGGTTAPGSR